MQLWNSQIEPNKTEETFRLQVFEVDVIPANENGIGLGLSNATH